MAEWRNGGTENDRMSLGQDNNDLSPSCGLKNGEE